MCWQALFRYPSPATNSSTFQIITAVDAQNRNDIDAKPNEIIDKAIPASLRLVITSIHDPNPMKHAKINVLKYHSQYFGFCFRLFEIVRLLETTPKPLETSCKIVYCGDLEQLRSST